MLINIKSRRLNSNMYYRVTNEIERLLKLGVIIPACSEFGFPIIPVVNTDDSIRIVGDFRLLNQVLQADQYAIPNLMTFVEEMVDCRYFSKLDLRRAFYQLKLDEESIHLATINRPFGSYSYCTIIEGLKVSATSFLRYLQLILSGIKNIFIHVDDILVSTKTKEEHLKVSTEILERLNYFGIKLNAEKCKVFAEEVVFLVYDIEKNKMRPNKEKVEAIKKYLCLKLLNS